MQSFRRRNLNLSVSKENKEVFKVVKELYYVAGGSGKVSDYLCKYIINYHRIAMKELREKEKNHKKTMLEEVIEMQLEKQSEDGGRIESLE